MTYKFEQFKIEIVDPTIEINYESVIINNINREITVDIVLIDDAGSKFGITLNNLPSNSESWDSVDLVAVVNAELETYKVA